MDEIDIESEKVFDLTFNAIPDLITLLDKDHKILRINKAMANRLGVSPEECVGKICFEVVHNRECPIENCPHALLLEDGSEHVSEVKEDNLGGFFLVTATPIVDSSGNTLGSVHVARDITQRKIMEDELHKALEDKDVLIKEVHHRVKNNLMILSSLLNLQSRYITDEKIQNIFKECQDRTRSLAIIHEKLYRSEDLKKIKINEYIESLVSSLYHSYTLDYNRIKVRVDVENLEFDADTSIPIGLIINELFTNAMKHAFPGNKTGQVTVELHSENDEFKLEVSDDGTGFPEDLDYKNVDSLGLRLVKSLTEQIDGKLELEHGKGTHFTVTFREL
ncbi:PAS domain-containing sensor histidine kinase [Methanobacterium aggregans]|uniref:PAS domain-containing sensor histidine kinase n=1 Tax=Methanobacterium aggregans TaxID=1615586 RepID=UPI001AE31F23|nr:histidine kinase dimerization/phosphoacceptor domain -containing protein [Methanobacterium aggregans]MBP2045395.1 PAS domain S-box-containing protein [Methanobacterium aggregans]